MKKALSALFLVSCILQGSTAIAEEYNKCVRGQYLISASVPSLRNKAEKLLEEVDTKEYVAVDESKHENIVLLQEEKEIPNGINDAADSEIIPKSKNVCERLRKKRRDDLITMAKTNEVKPAAMRRYDCSCNQIYSASDVSTNDPYFNQLWGMRSSSSYGIGAVSAWEKTTGNKQTVVAVIDTGVDYNHPDLIDNMWINSGEIPGNGIDDDGNGYIDDYHGWNAMTTGGNPMDDVGHGTHCSGTIGGRGNNSQGVVGVNWQVSIMPVKFLGPQGGTTYDAIEAVNYVTDQKLRGVNIVLSSNSWGGGGYDQFLYNAIERAKNTGILFVAAAGNGGSDGLGDNNDYTPSYPASYNLDNIVSVAAISSNGALTGFSNFGASSVDIAAPGYGIVSCNLSTGSVYSSMSGTSMATPHVSGALALLYSYNPNLTWSDLKNILLQTKYAVSSLSGKVLSGGIVNVSAMLDAAYLPGQTPVPTATATNTSTPQPTSLPTSIPSSTPTMTPSPTPTPGFYTFSGQIIGSNNAQENPLSGAMITLKYGSMSYTGYTDSLGNFSIPNIAGPITYSISITYPGVNFIGSAPLQVYMSQSKTMSFTGLFNAFKLSGQVINTEMQAVSGASITLNGENQNTVLTDTSGNFSFDVPAGMEYKISASLDGYLFNQTVLEGTILGNVKRIFVAKED
jgi:subtilisin family serine protease